MATLYSQGSVIKSKTYWRACIGWQDEGGRRRLTKSTNVRCYPDKIDPLTGKTIPDNRGKSTAETVLREWRAQLVAEQAEIERQTETSCSTPFAEYARRCIEDKERLGSTRTVTTKGYRSHLTRIEGSALGETPISQVTPKLIIAWERALFESGLSPSTISHLHVFAKQVCTHARKLGDLSANPFDLVEAPKRQRKPANSLDLNGVHALEKALVGYGFSPLATAIHIAVKTGMRQGEICALRWQDIDMGGRCINVSHALTRVSGTYALSSPKTRESVRSIPIGDSLFNTLLGRRKLMRKQRAEFGLPWDPCLYVIGSPLEPKWCSPMVLGQEWRALIKLLGLKGTQGTPPRFHDLRHTFATLAIAAGVDVKAVSAILGHANASMTLNVYADALADSKRAGMAALDSLISGNPNDVDDGKQ